MHATVKVGGIWRSLLGPKYEQTAEENASPCLKLRLQQEHLVKSSLV